MNILSSICFILILALQWLGGLFLLGLFMYGIYGLFAISIGYGALYIGLSVIGGWAINLACQILGVIAVASSKG